MHKGVFKSVYQKLWLSSFGIVWFLCIVWLFSDFVCVYDNYTYGTINFDKSICKSVYCISVQKIKLFICIFYKTYSIRSSKTPVNDVLVYFTLWKLKEVIFLLLTLLQWQTNNVINSANSHTDEENEGIYNNKPV